MTKKKVYLNHDGGVDDLVSLYLLLKMEDVELVGVGVIPADCYLEPAVSASRKIIDVFSDESKRLKVDSSNSRGKNPFPKEWRMQTFNVDALPVLNEHLPIQTEASGVFAHDSLIDILRNSDEKVTLIFTGPLTDLARALKKAPEIEVKIEKLVWMGGTFLNMGNVEEPEHDGTAEWNVFWDPEAAKAVWESSIEIDLVGLESTNKVPLTLDVRERWARERSHKGVDFLGQCYSSVPPLVHFHANSTYFLWDVLTVAMFGKPDLVKTEVKKSIVHDYGQSQGKTEETADGRPVNFVYDVDSDGFFDYITDLAKR